MAKVRNALWIKRSSWKCGNHPIPARPSMACIAFLRAVCHYAEKHKLLTDNPIDAVRAPPKIDAEIYVFSGGRKRFRFIRAVMREKDIRVKTALLGFHLSGIAQG